MKKLLLLMLVLSLSAWTMGQSTANYAFSYSFTGSLVDISSGATTMLTGNNDDTPTAVFDIGFTFYFMGVPYTKFSGNSNGQLRLGPTVASSTYSSYSASTAVLAAMSGDNEVNNGMTFKVIGTAPNRILVVEWNQFYAYYTNITGAGNMQALLYEGSGKIEYIYGEIYNSSSSSVTRSIYISASNTAGASGSVTVAAAPTYESSATTPTSNSFAASVLIANLGSTAQGSRTVYTFTPTYSTTPSAPISMTFTSVTNIGMTVNWVDNSSDETFFTLTRALDAAFTNGVSTTVLASTSITGTGSTYSSTISSLVPGVTYYYKVVACNEASAASAELTGNQTTLPPGNITSIADGSWSSTSTWPGGVLPTAADNVVIANNVTVDVATATCFNLTINSGKTLSCSGTAGVLTVASNAVNNGTLDFYVDASNYARLTFSYASNNSFTSGASCVTDLNTLTINKGTTKDNILEMNLSDLTIKGISTATVGFLTLTNGTLKVSGTHTFSGVVFTSAGYTIGATTGFWLNNPNFTITGQNGSLTLAGLFRISDGTWNIGTSAGNSVNMSTGATALIENGYVNVAGRFAVASSSNVVNFTQSGGTLTVCTVANTSTSYASFDLGSAATTVANLEGGSIVLQLASTATSGPRDFRGLSTSGVNTNYKGTALVLGNGSSAAAYTFYLSGNVPPMQISTSPFTHSVALYAAVYYHGDLYVPTGSTLNLNGTGFWCKGNVQNDGGINGTTTSSRFDFAGLLLNNPDAQTYSGSALFGPTASLATNLSLGINNATGVTLNGPINVYRVNMFRGAVTNSNNITIGTGSLACSVQIGVSGNTYPGGTFDVSPTWNLGTGTFTLLYEPETVARTTGFEIPPSRTLLTLYVENPLGVTLAGGNLTLDGAGYLYMNSGILKTSSSNMVVMNASASVSGGSTTSFIDGPMSRAFAASRTATGTYTGATLFPIGVGTSYLPAWVDPSTTADGPITIQSTAFTSNSGSMGGGVTTLSNDRWELPVTAGSANFSGAFLKLGDGNIISTDQILQANAPAGTYGAIPTSSVFVSGTPNTLNTGTILSVANYYGNFAYGNLNACSAPTAQPTAFVSSYITASGFSGSFTAATPAPSHYLIVRYASGATPTAPVDYTNYASGATLGTGTVVASTTATTFLQTGLTAATTYDYYVYSFNNSGCYGPVYLTSSPLYAAVTTCGTAVGVPGTPACSSTFPNNFTATWTASSTAGVTYIVDLSTSSTFATYVSGYEHLDIGTGTTYTFTGLTSATKYYLRIMANSGGTCYSVYTSTLTVTTPCDPYSTFPYTESFSAAFPTCWSNGEGVSGASYHWIPTTSDATYGAIGPQSGTHFMYLYVYLASTTYNPYYLTSPMFTLGATTRQVKYYYWLGASGYTTTPVPLTLQITTDGGATWTDLYAHTTANSVFSTTNSLAGWTQNIVPLTGYENQTVQLRFVSQSNYGSGFCDQGIDEFILENAPTCPQPSLLTAAPAGFQATLGWTENGTATSWDIEYGAPGFTLGTGTQQLGVTNPYTLIGLTPSTAYDYYVRANCGGGSYSVWSGPKMFTTTVACPAPTNLAATGITSGSANLGWTETGVATTWNIEYGPAGFTQGTGTTIQVTSNPYSLTGLTASTSYSFYVQAYCDASNQSTWAGPVTFTTACAAISTFPWTESFEGVTNPAFPSCWYKENGDWVTTYNGATTNDADARTGTQFLRDSWSATNEYMWTPGFALTAGVSYDFSFWWAGDNYDGWAGDVFYNTAQSSVGATQMGSSFVTSSTVTTKTYAQVSHTFVAPATGTYYFAIRVNATSVPWYLSFDDFSMDLTPTSPILTVSPASLNFGYTPNGGTSVEKTYTLSGINLTGTGNITVTAPANFEVSLTSGSGFGSTVLVPYTPGTLAATTIFARFIPTAVNTYYTGDISNAGDGATTVNVAVAGNSDVFTGYCASGATNDSDEEIFGVTVNGTTNAYDCSTVAPGAGSVLNQYSNFFPLGSLTSVDQGQTVAFTVSENECDGATFYSFGTAIWIDYNQDGDFGDANEQVFVESSTLVGPRDVTGSFVVPIDAVPGVTAMRITVAEGISGAGLTPCLLYGYGETEDYKITVTAPALKTVNLKLFLEGLYDGAGGLNQAYDEYGPHWAAGVADVVTLELHDGTTGALVTTLSNVNLSTTGDVTTTVPAALNGSYYIYVKHRNSITTSTATALSFAGTTISYDFTTGVGQAFGSNMKDIGGVAVFFAGDENQDTNVDASDMIDVDNDNAAFATGYLVTDIDGNGGIDSSDMIFVDNNNAAFVAAVLPF